MKRIEHTALVKVSIVLPEGTIEADESLVDMITNKELRFELKDLHIETVEEWRKEIQA
jgi:hypothetical protein